MNEILELQGEIARLEAEIDAQEKKIQAFSKENPSEIGQSYIEKRHRSFAMSKMLASVAPIIEKIQLYSSYRHNTVQQKPTEANMFTHVDYDDDGIEISGYNGPDLETLVIPEEVAGKAVRKISAAVFQNIDVANAILPYTLWHIGANAFYNCKELEYVRSPAFSIGTNAFCNCRELKHIQLSSLLRIGAGAFENCKSLKYIEFPESLQKIGGGCFRGSGLEEVVIPEHVHTVPAGCFFDCSELAYINLNDGVKTIETEAFSGTDIRKIVFPKSVEKVAASALNCSNSIDIVCLGERTQFVFDGPYDEYIMKKHTIYCLPESTVEKQAREFGLKAKPLSEYLNSGFPMEKVRELQDEISLLEQGVVFQKNTIETLSEISLVNTIGKNVRRKRRAIAISELLMRTSPDTKINVDECIHALWVMEKENTALNRKLTKAFFAEDAAQKETDATAAMLFKYNFDYEEVALEIECCEDSICGDHIKSLVLPRASDGKKIVAIGRYAFENMNIEEAIIPNTVTNIGVGAFKGCKNLKQIKLPKGLKEISGGCFYGAGLEKVVLPENIVTLRQKCFKNCTSLTQIVLNSSIETIEMESLCNTQIHRIVLPEALRRIDARALAFCRVDIAFLGMETVFVFGRCSNLEGCRNYIIYCLPGSAVEKQARERGLRVRPLSEFPKE